MGFRREERKRHTSRERYFIPGVLRFQPLDWVIGDRGLGAQRRTPAYRRAYLSKTFNSVNASVLTMNNTAITNILTSFLLCNILRCSIALR